MKRLPLLLVIALSIILPACQARTVATNTAPPAPGTDLDAVLDARLYLLWRLVTKFQEPHTVTIPPDGKIRIPLEPVQGTPESDPRLTVHVNLLDDQTGQAVLGTVLLGDDSCQGEVIYRDVNRFTVELPGQVEAGPIHLCILAEGYERWSQGFRHHLNHSRAMTFTIKLNPTSLEGRRSG